MLFVSHVHVCRPVGRRAGVLEWQKALNLSPQFPWCWFFCIYIITCLQARWPTGGCPGRCERALSPQFPCCWFFCIYMLAGQDICTEVHFKDHLPTTVKADSCTDFNWPQCPQQHVETDICTEVPFPSVADTCGGRYCNIGPLAPMPPTNEDTYGYLPLCCAEILWAHVPLTPVETDSCVEALKPPVCGGGMPCLQCM